MMPCVSVGDGPGAPTAFSPRHRQHYHHHHRKQLREEERTAKGGGGGGEDEDGAGGLDPEIAAAMGFGGFK